MSKVRPSDIRTGLAYVDCAGRLAVGSFDNYLFKLMGDADEYNTNRPVLRVTHYPGVGRHCNLADAIALAVRTVLLCNFDSFKAVGNNVSIATNHKPPCVDSVCGN